MDTDSSATLVADTEEDLERQLEKLRQLEKKVIADAS